MLLTSWNVNGIRAVHKKGALLNFLESVSPDVLLLQEIKGTVDKFPEELLDESKYKKFFHSAEKAGYSGVGIFVSKGQEKNIQEFTVGMTGFEDSEGRVARVDFKNGLTAISVYVPNGGKSEEAFQGKIGFFSFLRNYLNEIVDSGRSVIIGGDFNVARSEIDLASPEKKENNVCYRSEIREKMEILLDSGFVDTYRDKYPDKEGAYTYWDNFDFSIPRGVTPREINKGWRLDYFLSDKKTKIKNPQILQEFMGSDHCPISIET